MDYKYIEQLLERYWACETTLQEEEILRTFFSQEDVPADLQKYRALFVYAQQEATQKVLGDDFDEKILSMIDEPTPVKARTIKMRQRLMPLFKAAAVVAIILTLSNALQVPFMQNNDNVGASYDGTEQLQQGTSVAIGDSATIDSMQQSNITPADVQPATIIK